MSKASRLSATPFILAVLAFGHFSPLPNWLESWMCIARNFATRELFVAVRVLVESGVLEGARTCDDRIELEEWFNVGIKGHKLNGPHEKDLGHASHEHGMSDRKSLSGLITEYKNGQPFRINTVSPKPEFRNLTTSQSITNQSTWPCMTCTMMATPTTS